MKSKILFLALLFSGLPLFAAESVPSLNALLSMGRDSRFVLGGADGQTSGWLKLGDEYAGFSLKAFDVATSELELTRDGRSSKIKLQVGSAAGGPAGAAFNAGSVADANELLRVMRFDEMLGRMMDQQKKALQPMLAQSLNQALSRLNLSDTEKAEMLAFQQKSIDELMSSVMGPEFRANIAQVYTEIFTKEELTAQANFYSTPVGQAVVDKTPAAQAKLQELMAPRLTQGMGKMQQSTQEFMRQMAAKRAANAAPGAPPAN